MLSYNSNPLLMQ